MTTFGFWGTTFWRNRSDHTSGKQQVQISSLKTTMNSQLSATVNSQALMETCWLGCRIHWLLL